MTQASDPRGRRLAREARLFSRYLLRRDPPPEMIGRYQAACARLFPTPPEAEAAAVLSFVSRHAWALGPIDAVLAWREPEHDLRRRLLVMSAILEASPRFADLFLPPASIGLGRLAWRLARAGCGSAVKCALGPVVLAWARRGAA